MNLLVISSGTFAGILGFINLLKFSQKLDRTIFLLEMEHFLKNWALDVRDAIRS